MATRKTRLYKIYRENQAAHKYLLGCIYKGGLYLCYMDDIPPRMIQCDKKGLRMRVYTKKDIAYIVKRGFYVGPASLLDSDIYNKGVMLEQVVITLPVFLIIYRVVTILRPFKYTVLFNIWNLSDSPYNQIFQYFTENG